MFQALSAAAPLIQLCPRKQDKAVLGFEQLGSLCLNTLHGRRDDKGKHQRLACLHISVSYKSTMEISEISASCRPRISDVSLSLVQVSGFLLLLHWTFPHLAACHCYVCCYWGLVTLHLLVSPDGFLLTSQNWIQDLWMSLLAHNDQVQVSHNLKLGCRRLEGKSSD
ncbi:hypothetical protein EUTSA_v10014867mg [Eutrema salsugineum]|uniref:Uncharacterized protein n=1 Tax=Eutrema salsugineum TaxID=72664 RepID=V4LHD1_EUTSA|nr:hypothetical protein EUTSA_v10014867mg [Eutrema salsugineum]